MTKERWDREREALRRLARVLAEEARGGLLEEALEIVLEATRAEAGAAFAVNGASLELVSERGLGKPTGRTKSAPPLDLRLPVTAAGRRAASGRKPVYLVDLAEARSDAERRDDLVASGFRSLLARAVKHQRHVHGVIVLVSKDASLFDPARLAFVETVTHMVALAAECGRRSDREADYRNALMDVGRLSALGTLAAAVAHELKGPAGSLGVQLATQEEVVARMRDSAPQWTDPMMAELSDLIVDAKSTAAQVNSIAGRLASASRTNDNQGTIDLSVAARDTLDVARGELRRRGLSLTEDYAPNCLTSGRRDQIVQVILGLVFHAADACAAMSHPRPAIVVRTGIDGSRAMLSIEDTGPTVPADELGTLFQPFADKREGSRPVGFGLIIASDLVTALHGRIEATNLENGGVSFRVVLPRVADASQEDARLGSTQPPPNDTSDSRRVMVVDDDDLLARTVRRALRPHDVRSAATASEAEIALLDPTYLPHLVLCDLSLPGLTGDMLHARIRAKRPEVAQKFVFITAGAQSQREADYLSASGCPTLLKPLDMREIWLLLNLPAPTASKAPPERSSSLPPNSAGLRTQPSGPRHSGAPTRRPE
jgi:signal transduction histidine kinase/ActR/RegA family two-component response regulator